MVLDENLFATCHNNKWLKKRQSIEEVIQYVVDESESIKDQNLAYFDYRVKDKAHN